MGTLSGQDVRLPDHCEHKLPTSCRLTSLRNCCACADERAHSPTYTTYIDGVGLVPRGRRWDRYCWFCKEFWSHRVAATNLLPSQTRIPEVPDQTTFLERWYEFHRGYRIVTSPDGWEERIAVLGEPWGDVSPGHLPRTLDELRAGTVRSAADPVQHITVERSTAEDGPSLEETFDRLLEQTESVQIQSPPRTTRQVAGNVMQPATESIQIQSPPRTTRQVAGNEGRGAENARRVFGTREDMDREDWVSPINQMFTRAYDRFRDAEQARRENRTPPVWGL
ncbi:hypothetical protein BDZ85DRAFT_187088, partial [Elsinoe ampelina]